MGVVLKKKREILGILLFVFMLNFVFAAAILDELHLNIQTIDGSGNVITGTFDFDFNISTTSDCNNVIYSDSAILTTDSRGIISYYLTNVNLGYDNQYYLCHYRDGSLINNSKIARSPYAFRAKYVNVSGIEVDSNLDLSGFNLSADYVFGDGSGLTNINASSVNYWLKNGNNLHYNSGNVGIGTDSPSEKLEIEGNVLLGNDSTDAYQLLFSNNNGAAFFDGAGSMVFGSGSGRSLRFRTGGFNSDSFTKMIIDSSGNVGIGTNSPASQLHVKDESDDVWMGLDSPSANQAGFRFYSDGNSRWLVNKQATSNDLRFYSYGISDSVMLLDYDTGNVGIGTDSPSVNLDVRSTTGDVAMNLVAINGNDSRFVFGETDENNGGLMVYDGGSNFFKVGTVNAGSDVLPLFIGKGQAGVGIGSQTSGNNVLRLTRLYGGYDMFRIEGQQYTSLVTEEGLWGINTTTPQNALNVVGDLNVTGTIYGAGFDGVESYWNSTGSNLYPSNLSKSIGIGTDDATSPLTISSGDGSISELSYGGNNATFTMSGAGGVRLDTDSHSTLYGFGIGMDPIYALDVAGVVRGNGFRASSIMSYNTAHDGTLNLAQGGNPSITRNQADTRPTLVIQNYNESSTGDILQLKNSSDTLFVVDGTGNVGIGTESPSHELNVVGDLNVTGTIYGAGFDGIEGYWNSTGGNLYPSDLSKNIGIGTITPQSNLHINGSGIVLEGTKAIYRDSGGGSLAAMISVSSGDDVVVGSTALDDISFTTGSGHGINFLTNNGQQRMVIGSSGNVGINETSPEAKLHVSGDVIIEL